MVKKYNLHVIIDEIYMLSVFDESITFHSVLSVERPKVFILQLFLHNLDCIVSSPVCLTPTGPMDFGISGFHFGALHTQNKEVASAVSSFDYLHNILGASAAPGQRMD
ncbi:putative inactive 1-aminocyclopropane-1-carboxylate synthase-like protein 2 [Manis javanica]|nr:putative inactive 1-aminocyclopropane-1-carboxylate synthase-like protein 2 [Manis javanica]